MRILIAATLALALPASAMASAMTPQTLGERFCTAMLDPSSDPLTLVTPALADVITSALARNAEIQAAVPDEKPPLGDGIPWRSWQDLPDGCAVGPIDNRATQSGVTLRYSFSEEADADFEDVLVVAPIPGHAPNLGVDDIVFSTGSTLREALDAAFAQ